MKNNWVLFIILTFLSSCSFKQVYTVENPQQGSNDSTFLYRDNQIVRIEIGDYLNPQPLSTQFYEDSINKYYMQLDENRLYIIDLNNERQIVRDLKECGSLNNYSGFLFLKDTLFVYAYKSKTVFMLNNDNHVMNKWVIKDESLSRYPVDGEAITDTPMSYIYPKLFVSGSTLGNLEGEELNKHPVECCLDISNGRLKYGVEYPEIYQKADWGGVYLNQLCHSNTDTNNLVLSFPVDHYVHFYSPELSHEKKVYMGSRYSKGINSSAYDSFDLFTNKELRVKYYISQHSYSRIIYDKYRKFYYRIAYHPLYKWDGGNFQQPFSIIVSNVEGELVCETPIVEDYSSLNLHNMHVTKDGLLIQKKCENENVVEFVKYVIRG